MRERNTTNPPRATKWGVVLRALAFCMLVCSLLVAGTSFASYSSASVAEDDARVAAGIVEVNHDANTAISMERPDDDGEASESFGFAVSNGAASEVAVEYDITVILKQTLPEGISMELQNKEGKTLGVINGGSGGTVLAASGAGVFRAGEADEHEYWLVFTGDFSVYRTEGKFEYPAVISVKAEQID